MIKNKKYKSQKKKKKTQVLFPIFIATNIFVGK